jgi:hypothetical protein
MLTFELAQDVLQPFLDPLKVAGGVIGGGLQPLQLIAHALFEVSKRRRVVATDRHPIETIRQGPQRIFNAREIVVADRHAVDAVG